MSGENQVDCRVLQSFAPMSSSIRPKSSKMTNWNSNHVVRRTLALLEEACARSEALSFARVQPFRAGPS